MVLAAGASTRLGEAKQLAVLGGERLLERAVRMAAEAGCAPVVVVLGARAEEVVAVCALGEAEMVRNADWAEGMASSLRVGLAALGSEAAGAVLMVCDQPAVSAAHLAALIKLGVEQGCAVGSAYAGRVGVPAYLPAIDFARALSLKGDAGARDLLRDAAWIELPDGELDVDTPELLAQARERFGRDG